MKQALICLALLGFLASSVLGDEIMEGKMRTRQLHGTVKDRQRLVENIFHGYDKRVNPTNFTVKFGLALINFDVCEKKHILNSYTWFRYVWKDERLAWDKTEYGGVDVIRYDSDLIWKPDITIYNSADTVNMMNCWNSQVLIYPSGEVLWVPPCKIASYCDFSHLKKEPYAEQTCKLKFGSWTYDGYTMHLDFYKNQIEKGNSTSDTSKMIDMSDLHNTSGYEIVSTNAEKQTKFYSCCEEPYESLTYNMTIKKIPGKELER